MQLFAHQHYSSKLENLIGCVMVSVLASSAVYHGFEPLSGPTKTINFVFFASPLSMQHEGEGANTDWLGIRIMCLSGATCLFADCCFSELSL